jgi:hypothetical protein
VHDLLVAGRRALVHVHTEDRFRREQRNGRSHEFRWSSLHRRIQCWRLLFVPLLARLHADTRKRHLLLPYLGRHGALPVSPQADGTQAMRANPVLERKVEETTKKLVELCDSPTEMLTVLIHVTASTLSFVVEPKKKPDRKKYVVSYLMQITRLFDAAERLR